MAKKKKVPTPLPFRILKSSFPFLETIAPWLAKKIVVRLFFTPFRFKPRPGEEDLIASAEEFHLEVNGQRVFGRSWGKGAMAVLCHGWSGRGMQLRHFINPLVEAGYQVITFDAPGHGRSEGKESSLLEFKDSLFEISKKFGPIKLAIGHSLGGASFMYAVREGLAVEQLITISTPTIPEKIVEEFLRRINGSQKMGGAIDEYVRKRTGNPFNHYSGVVNGAMIKDTPILSFHDHDDKEAGIEHAYALKEVHPTLEIIETQDLGHNRILKSPEVIQKVSDKARTLLAQEVA